MGLWHLTIASDGRQPLFRGEAARRAAVRALVRTAGADMALFCVVDDHVHIVILGERDRVGQVSRSVVLRLRPLADTSVEPARVRPVETRAHSEWLLNYVLNQVSHHRLGEHAALWTGSCFQDLVGARALPGLTLRLGEALPRLGRSSLRTLVGLRGAPDLVPAPDDVLRAAGATRIAAAAAAAHAVGPDLASHAPEVVAARRAAAQVAREAGIATQEIAFALRQSDRTARRLVTEAAPRALVRAVRIRIALEGCVARAPARPPT